MCVFVCVQQTSQPAIGRGWQSESINSIFREHPTDSMCVIFFVNCLVVADCSCYLPLKKIVCLSLFLSLFLDLPLNSKRLDTEVYLFWSREFIQTNNQQEYHTVHTGKRVDGILWYICMLMANTENSTTINRPKKGRNQRNILFAFVYFSFHSHFYFVFVVFGSASTSFSFTSSSSSSSSYSSYFHIYLPAVLFA